MAEISDPIGDIEVTRPRCPDWVKEWKMTLLNIPNCGRCISEGGRLRWNPDGDVEIDDAEGNLTEEQLMRRRR